MKKYFSTVVVIAIFFSTIHIYAGSGEGVSSQGALNSYPYILKRIVDNSFDYFQIRKNNWRFSNDQNTVMWPESWWEQFDYSQSIYPYLWHFKKSSTFPDWPLFVEVFSEEYCYWNPPPGLVIYSPSAVASWWVNSGQWAGSCFGLAASSVLAFNSENEFKQRFPVMAPYESLHEITNITDEIRKVINFLWTVQLNNQTQKYRDNNINKTPDITLAELKTELTYPNHFDKILWLDNQNGSSGIHVVTPYLIKVGTTVDTIEIYDNNYQSNLNPQKILIDKQNKTWDYKIDNVQWGGSKGLFLTESLTGYLSLIPNPSKIGKENNTIEVDTILSVYSETDDNIIIKNLLQQNEFIHFNPIDTSIVNTFLFVNPIIPATGGIYPPVGYRLLDGNYEIKTSSYNDSSSNILIKKDNLIYNYSRIECDSSDTDILKIQGNNLLLENEDQVNKNTNFKIIYENVTFCKTYSLTNTLLSFNDTLSCKIDQNQEFILSNRGAAKTYDLQLVFQNSGKEDLFSHNQIQLPFNTTHKIVPYWDSLYTIPIKILIDQDQNGIFEDSIIVINQLTSINTDDGSDPSHYVLNQNYPNPFNPSTSISFVIAEDNKTVLSVYNLIGELIAVIVDKELSAGSYQFNFDAGKLSSGVYLIKLQSGAFSDVKKMVILK